MRKDSRLSRMLHVLLHMARHDRPFNSTQIAKMLGTNPAVVRRTMAGLREGGYVTSTQGKSGGWTIACELSTTSLFDIFIAVGDPTLFVIGIDNPAPTCAVEQVINHSLNDTLYSAELLIKNKLKEVYLSDLISEFDMLCQQANWGGDGPL